MSIVSAIVLFAVVWFMVLFIVLPIRLETQGDRGEIVPGTQAGAPANLQMRRKVMVTTGIAVVIWAVLCAVILSGIFGLDDLDFLRRYGAPSLRDG
jgi:predicted secreted protein